ncbi:hypothetical protein Droror1_Dr00015165 [Drosera rotundifolia]
MNITEGYRLSCLHKSQEALEIYQPLPQRHYNTGWVLSQGFVKSLLDVADNLGRASSAVKENFAKIDAATDTTGAVPLLKTLLEGVEMTEKQLLEVFKKFEPEKYDPIEEQFDPNRHNAVFQVPDESKAPGTILKVLFVEDR